MTTVPDFAGSKSDPRRNRRQNGAFAMKLKETEADQAVRDKVMDTTAAELRQFIERVEQLELEKKETGDLIKEVYAELKCRGYDTKAVREIVKIRKADRDQLAEHEAVVELYKQCLGL